MEHIDKTHKKAVNCQQVIFHDLEHNSVTTFSNSMTFQVFQDRYKPCRCLCCHCLFRSQQYSRGCSSRCSWHGSSAFANQQKTPTLAQLITHASPCYRLRIYEGFYNFSKVCLQFFSFLNVVFSRLFYDNITFRHLFIIIKCPLNVQQN